MHLGRSTYESELDRKNERAAVKYLRRVWPGVGFKRQPKFNAWDRDLSRAGQRIAIMEVKRRFITVDQYPTIMMEAWKFNRCIEEATRARIPFLFVVRCNDGTLVYRYNKRDRRLFESRIGGRTVQARDEADSSSVVIHIPIHLFRFPKETQP